MEPESVVIVKGNNYYVAYIRYKDVLLNIDIAHEDKYILHSAIHRYLWKVKRNHVEDT